MNLRRLRRQHQHYLLREVQFCALARKACYQTFERTQTAAYIEMHKQLAGWLQMLADTCNSIESS